MTGGDPCSLPQGSGEWSQPYWSESPFLAPGRRSGQPMPLELLGRGGRPGLRPSGRDQVRCPAERAHTRLSSVCSGASSWPGGHDATCSRDPQRFPGVPPQPWQCLRNLSKPPSGPHRLLSGNCRGCPHGGLTVFSSRSRSRRELEEGLLLPPLQDARMHTCVHTPKRAHTRSHACTLAHTGAHRQARAQVETGTPASAGSPALCTSPGALAPACSGLCSRCLESVAGSSATCPQGPRGLPTCPQGSETWNRPRNRSRFEAISTAVQLLFACARLLGNDHKLRRPASGGGRW